MTGIQYRQVLLLNMNYTPLGVVSWRKAINLVIGREKASVLEDYEERRSTVFDAAVIRLDGWSPDPYILHKKQKFSKRNVFLRDKFLCGYCQTKLVGKELTIDHVLPRAKGGITSYENCATACKPCNVAKGNILLQDWHLSLKTRLRVPSAYDIFNAIRVPPEWKNYLVLK